MNDALKMTSTQRAQRTAHKRDTLLRFLRDEVYTTAPIAAVLLGLSERQAARTLKSMQRDELLTYKKLTTDSGWAPVLWGITGHGQGMACLPGEFPNERAFEPARVALSMLKHTLGLQLLRVQAHAQDGQTGRAATGWQSLMQRRGPMPLRQTSKARDGVSSTSAR
jgi:predicted ArsR family transcriptional regulator